jgi:hypothetical protein
MARRKVMAKNPSGVAGAPENVIVLSFRQVVEGREALRDWLGGGKDELNVTNGSLDMALTALLSRVFRKEVRLCTSRPSA